MSSTPQSACGDSVFWKFVEMVPVIIKVQILKAVTLPFGGVGRTQHLPSLLRMKGCVATTRSPARLSVR